MGRISRASFGSTDVTHDANLYVNKHDKYLTWLCLSGIAPPYGCQTIDNFTIDISKKKNYRFKM